MASMVKIRRRIRSVICSGARCGASGGKAVVSAGRFDALKGLRHDLGKPFGGFQLGELAELEPARVRELLVELRLARDPARREAQDDEMAERPPVPVAD